MKTHTEFALEPKWLRAILVSANKQRFEGVYVIRESTESNKEVVQINTSLILNFSLKISLPFLPGFFRLASTKTLGLVKPTRFRFRVEITG